MAQPGIPSCFTAVEGQQGIYSCLACAGSQNIQLASIRRHFQNQRHLDALQEWQANRDLTPASISSNHDTDSSSNSSSNSASENDSASHIDSPMITTLVVRSDDNNEDARDFNQHQRTLIDLWTQDQSGVFDNMINNIDRILEQDTEDEEDHSLRSEDSDPAMDSNPGTEPLLDQNDDGLPWDPFSSLEQLVGLLIIGSTRTTMSQRQYKHARSYVSLLGVKLPGYKSVCNLCQRLKARYNFDVTENLSPLGKPTFRLKVEQILSQELANPYVAEHLRFMPELPSATSQVDRLAQSKRWREELDRDLRVQMINLPQGHFYISFRRWRLEVKIS